MKKILIFSHAMEIGGAERALLGLLETIDKTRYEVDLFLMSHTGDLMSHIPEGINLLPKKPAYCAVNASIVNALKQGEPLIAITRLVGKMMAIRRAEKLHLSAKFGVAIEYSHKYTRLVLPAISKQEYDLAISFLTPHYFVAEKVNAKKKIAWIHTDYQNTPIDVESETKMWAKYEHIVSISEEVTNSFVRVFPSLKRRVVLIENIMPMELLHKQKMQKTVENEMPEDGSIKLLTIGRFSPQKNMENIPEICSKIKERNIDIKWYLIGFGGHEELIRQKIEEYNVQDKVIILGKKENPYPYIGACDVYVQPSLCEGKSVAVREAQILNKPVIITNFSTARSQLRDGYDGLIVPMDTDECAGAISDFLTDQKKQQMFINNTKQSDYTNSAEIQKLYDII